MAFDSEEESFRAHAAALRNDCIFLVDTHDTLAGVRPRNHGRAHAARTRAREAWHPARLGGGDLSYLSIEARRLFDGDAQDEMPPQPKARAEACAEKRLGTRGDLFFGGWLGGDSGKPWQPVAG
jgi:hypothetical protein